MALPFLIKHVYNNASDEIIRRSKKMHLQNYCELTEHDELASIAVFRVKDDVYNSWYKVHIQQYKSEANLTLRCTCANVGNELCKHKGASLMQLQDLLDKNLLSSIGTSYNQQHTLIKLKTIELKTIKMLCSTQAYEDAEAFLQSNKALIEHAANEKVVATITINNEEFKVVLSKNEERNFDTSCNCVATQNPLCEHKTILFLQLLNAYGANYFDSIRNWDKDKNKLLALYGYSLSDNLTNKFDFTYKDGKPFLRVLDTTIKRVEQLPTAGIKPQPIAFHKALTTVTETPVLTPTIHLITNQKEIGVVINCNPKQYPFFTVDIVEGVKDTAEQLANISWLDITKYVNLENYTPEQVNLIQLARKLQQAEIEKFITRNSPFAQIWDSIIKPENEPLDGDTENLVIEYINPKLKQLVEALEAHQYIYLLPKGKVNKTTNLVPITIAATQALQPCFMVNDNAKNYTVECYVQLQHQAFSLTDNECGNPFMYLHNRELILWQNATCIIDLKPYNKTSSINITKKNWPTHLTQNIIPLTRLYKVDFDKTIIQEIKDGEPEVKIVLQEKGDYLVFLPQFDYKGYTVKENDKDFITVAEANKVVLIKRNKDAEALFLKKVENLHSNFIRPQGTQTLALKGNEVLKNNWYFLFVENMRELGIVVEGFEVLKNFKFNTAKPTTKIFINSETDWFDAKVQINFGDQQITVADVKRAIALKQQFVPLADGTLGILPEEWLKKYSLLFRMGEGKQDKLKLSKYHFSVIDELYDERDSAELVFQLEEKYEKLKDNYKIESVPAPAHLEPILRPYQTSGFQWLNYLGAVGWGGILADDMGLGKTIQALTNLHYYNQKHGKLLALVVCPTTLIYNWENEIKKFTPSLTHHIHHGGDRQRSKALFMQHNIIITTYGTLRSDIKLFVECPFDYAVLDESQAIKNPVSKVTKAACLLTAKHKVCMSGTPLQNNTFDIYAQMSFLNPGMLGSMDSFRNEFSMPIDKLGDVERKEHLRKILYPFILRRTKEQVAKDLPAKTEMILWCEMEAEQRNIYEAFRNEYKDNIMGSIESKGIGRSQLTILQGLMKLRQICDSPAIMNSDEVYPNVSVKVDELARELEENCGDHKVLVFSQFLGMLALIRKKLEDVEIPYEYFDGSSSATERQTAINNFQNKEHVRVFLISLKAGGVGLNLTAADYVYIVDPWWNPAVEQQAIDRTHRIGQTKNIFAYRMICKDTVEDKIIQLQERKKQLAKDIVTDDDAFIKTLSKDDVAYLFS